MGKKHTQYANLLSNLSMVYFNQAEHIENETMDTRKVQLSKALQLEEQALQIREEIYGSNNSECALSRNKMSAYYFGLGDTENAIKNLEIALQIRKEIYGENHPTYATTFSNLAYMYGCSGHYNESIINSKKALEIFEKANGKNHPSYIMIMSNLAPVYALIGDYTNAQKYEEEFFNVSKEYILNTFADQSSSERTLMWNQYRYTYNTFFPSISFLSNTQQMNSTLYDNSALFAKGLLLGAETEMTKLIQESGDAEALKKYETLKENRKILQKLYEKPVAERTINADSLQNVVNAQEKELVSMCKVYGDFTKNLRTTWKDVQQHLGNQDLAVEFLSFPTRNDSTMYIALTLCKNDTAPQMVTLFEQKQLKALSDTITFNCSEMTALVWGKMKEQLKGIKNIYFSPAGQLYNIGIEYLPGMEDYNIYRLSSTRELANHEIPSKTNKAVVYGNINYNSPLVAHTSNFSASDEQLLADNRGVRFLRGLRQSVGALPNSKKEVEDVSKALKSSNVKCVTLMNDSATEESFKALSGKQVNLLHIATHGFYFSENEAQEMQGMQFMQTGSQSRSGDTEDKALTRSAICFAGANATLDEDSIPEGVDDGILTAQEIAQVDLRGLDLVVLSACQTACGDINQGEGVFGLQRGFKKAGAQSLLMSLWPVDDEATQILMSEFYKQYTSGKTKRAAFQAAQQHLRTVDNGRYNQPKYWAAFILLDAID